MLLSKCIIMNKIVRVLLRILLGLILLVESFWLYLNYDSNLLKVNTSQLNHFLSKDIKQYKVPVTKSNTKNIIVKNGQFYASGGRSLFLRGINLGGNTKVPFTPDTGSHINKGYF